MMNADMSLEDEKKTPELEDVKVAEAEALAADALRAAEEARSAAAKLADLRASIRLSEKKEPQEEEAVTPVEDVVEPQDETAPESAADDTALTTEEAAPEVSEPEASTPLMESSAEDADLPQKPAEVRKDIFSRLFDAMGMDNLCGTSSAQVYVDPMDNGIPVDFMSEGDTVAVDEESVALNTIPGSTPDATGEGLSVPVPVMEMPTPVPEESLEAELPVAEEASEVGVPVAENATEEAAEANKDVVETVEDSDPEKEATKEATAEITTAEVAEEASPVQVVADESTEESAPVETETTETTPVVLEETVEEPANIEEVVKEAAPAPEDTNITTVVPTVDEPVEETVSVVEEISPALSKDDPGVEQVSTAPEKVQVVTPEPIKIPTSQKEGVGELSVVKQTILLDRKRNKLLAKPDPFSGEVESLDFIACGNGDVACGAPTAFPNVDDDSLVEETEVTVATSPIICGWGA